VFVQSEASIYQKTYNLRKFTYAIVGSSLLLAFLASWGVYRGMSAPLLRLAYGIRQIRLGNLSSRLQVSRPDEFGQLMVSFNEMAEEQQHLINNIYQQQILIDQTKFRLLQSQINPHFLYNTLDSIYWTAKNYDAEEISEMVLNLSNFFRLNMAKEGELVSVEETTEHLGYYLKVQQIRYSNHFSVRFEIDEETRDIPVLKLILQPLVENAILHGLEKKSAGGELIIRSSRDDHFLRLQVYDSGMGIDTRRLAYILNELGRITHLDVRNATDKGSSSNELYGLSNVKARLVLFYGEDAQFDIKSELGEGTTVTAIIPLKPKETRREVDRSSLDSGKGALL
jgi:two-component system sensor histidine kinase YesM